MINRRAARSFGHSFFPSLEMAKPADAVEAMAASLAVLFGHAANNKGKQKKPKRRVGRFVITDAHNPEFCAELRRFIDAYDLMSTALTDALEASGETTEDYERRNAAMMRASRMMPNHLHDVSDKAVIEYVKAGTKLLEKTAMELLLVEQNHVLHH